MMYNYYVELRTVLCPLLVAAKKSAIYLYDHVIISMHPSGAMINIKFYILNNNIIYVFTGAYS